MPARILVVGSINTDLVIRSQRLPQPGETIRGDGFKIVPGGKGSNQAVAAGRLGGAVTMIGRVGDDAFGPVMRGTLEAAGVDTTEVKSLTDTATGVAFILLDEAGENSIIIAGGANAHLSAADIEAAGALFDAADVLLLQLEIPLDAVAAAISMAKARNVRVVLDAGPPTPLSLEMLRQVDVLSPNETEAAALLGHEIVTIDDARAASRELLDLGVGSVVFKLGERGCMVVTREYVQRLPAYKVNVVDTTGAGDAFTAALAVILGEGKSLAEASSFASAAGALAVQKFGAQPSMPTRAEAEAFLASPPLTRE